ncbi:winged helix-turn-helix transcriptional regulator [Streptomyces sp. YC504]|uniref:Winged helix-turn-helix transcriptional regulator n=1 Tax=Streptomyces mesophilus TaxID=1775132 RepID=A0A6G4XWF4_9ACTN|nr:winged helix-turn-helix domain-containing protein [Streptomyces mesophilus]NGO81778.1 winged helix-turn-helix transcriptional regulator [Streptomyces mesophilus]
MLRIAFGREDLGRLRVAPDADPLWELVLSLHLLQNRQSAVVFDPWRREVRAGLVRAGLMKTTAALIRLSPWAAYFPDFLTPSRGDRSLEEGISTVLSTPRRQLSAELSEVYAGAPVPSAVRLLAEGDVTALEHLGHALRSYYAVAVEPYLPAVRGAVADDRAVRSAAALHGGAAELLSSYGPALRRAGSTLVADYPVARDMPLHGRPLTLVPSFFCVVAPVALADDALDPVLVHPLGPAPGWLARTKLRGAAPPPVTQLIGPTRALVLDALEQPRSTGQLAQRLRLTASTASRHATVLREAGLVASVRRGNCVLHRRTALGDALMDGRL